MVAVAVWSRSVELVARAAAGSAVLVAVLVGDKLLTERSSSSSTAPVRRSSRLPRRSGPRSPAATPPPPPHRGRPSRSSPAAGGAPRLAGLAGVAVGIAVAVAASRVLLDVHWLTDVLGGLALGWAWFAACAIAFGGRVLRFGAAAQAAGSRSSGGRAGPRA